MTKETILKKVIEQAVKNGLKAEFNIDYSELTIIDIYFIIFSHDFAKAFFGKKKVFAISSYGCHPTASSSDDEPHWDGDKESDNSVLRRVPAWQYHLQQMVLEKDKIKYLKKFLTIYAEGRSLKRS